MLKNALATILTVMLSVSMIGCSSLKKTEKEEPSVVESEIINTGTFSKDYTKDEVESLNLEISEATKELITFYGLEYTEETETKVENKEKVVDDYIYFDNLEVEPNRIESVYYSYKTYGESQPSVSFSLTMGFKLDLDQIQNENKFNFEETSMKKFIEVITKDSTRDYSDINNKIIEIVNSDANSGSIVTNVDGLVETIMIKGDYLLYKLDSKVYKFNNQ